MGEAANPGPDSKLRRSHRLRALWSQHGDTDAQATDTKDEQPAPSPLSEVIHALEEDLLARPRDVKASRRVVLVPEDSQGLVQCKTGRHPVRCHSVFRGQIFVTARGWRV